MLQASASKVVATSATVSSLAVAASCGEFARGALGARLLLVLVWRLLMASSAMLSPSSSSSFSSPSQRLFGAANAMRIAAAAASASRDQQQRRQSQDLCAMTSNAGICVTFRDVERALARARAVLGSPRVLAVDADADEPSEAALDAAGELAAFASRALAQRFRLDWSDIASGLPTIDTSQTSLWASCPRALRSVRCAGLSRFRAHSGLCNNLLAPHAGAANTAFVRFLPPDYADGAGAPRGSLPTLAFGVYATFSANNNNNHMAGAGTSAPISSTLPEPRLVSRLAFPDLYNPAADSSLLFVGFGQILNHDLALAAPAGADAGHPYACCGSNGRRRASRRRNCMPISVERADPLYAQFGIRCLDFKRSIAGPRPGCALGPREPLNAVTAFIDGNFVYGSSESAPASLRASGEGVAAGGALRGQLRSWNYFGGRRKPLLPPDDAIDESECVAQPPGLSCFLSGDRRVNQQVHLTVLHTVAMRQHNRLAAGLALLNPHWSDARVYHEARHIFVAQLQHVLVGEYLPQLLGDELVERHNLTEAPVDAYWDHYEPAMDASVAPAFASAAFRFGHSMVPSEVPRFNAAHRLLRVDALRGFYRQPWVLFEAGALDELLLGQLDAPAQASDPFLSADVAGHLLQTRDESVGHDLAAINIQRGRDHGLPGYNLFREWCGLERVESFEELAPLMSNRSAFVLAQLYAHVDHIDLFVGGLSEFSARDALVGPTFACIIGRQFQRTRFGDRFWFESTRGPNALLPAQLASIKSVPLARIICANADFMPSVQRYALKQPHAVLNPRELCAALPEIDLSLWREMLPLEQ